MQYHDRSPTGTSLLFIFCNLYTQLNNNRLLCLAPGQPQKLKSEAITSNSIQLSWESPEPSSASIDSYELYFHDSHSQKNLSVTVTSPRNSFLLEDLAPDTFYDISISAKSANIEGARTPNIQARTVEYGRSFFSPKKTLLLKNVINISSI